MPVTIGDIAGHATHFHLYASPLDEALLLVGRSAAGIVIAEDEGSSSAQVALVERTPDLRALPTSRASSVDDPLLALKALFKAILIPLLGARPKRPWWRFW